MGIYLLRSVKLLEATLRNSSWRGPGLFNLFIGENLLSIAKSRDKLQISDKIFATRRNQKRLEF